MHARIVAIPEEGSADGRRLEEGLEERIVRFRRRSKARRPASKASALVDPASIA